MLVGEHTAGEGAKGADPSLLGYGCSHTFALDKFQFPFPILF